MAELIEQDDSFPEDFGVDYCLMQVNVDKYPSYVSELDPESGEIIHKVKNNKKTYPYSLPILIDPHGINVVPANLYLHSLLSNPSVTNIKTIQSHALALLSFYRFLNMEIPAHSHLKTGGYVEKKPKLSIYSCTEKVEESPIVKYRDFLLEHVYSEDENGKISGAPSTAASYVLKIVSYYIYLHGQRIIECCKTFRPFEFTAKRIQLGTKTQRSQHDLLAHTHTNGRTITVYTTGLTKPFKHIQKPNGVVIRELLPLREDEKQAFYKYLDVENTTETKALMLYLKTEVGLRLEELVTFPASVVTQPKAEIVKVQIGESINGCLTKNKKNRTIEIPSHVMDLLYEYKLSKARRTAIERGLLRHHHLFVQSNGKIYAPNTIQKYLETIRNHLIMSGLDCYFTTHDLRATYATDWLYKKHSETGLPFEMLISELASLLGHESTATTQKYVNYMRNEKTWSEFAKRKNQFAQRVLK